MDEILSILLENDDDVIFNTLYDKYCEGVIDEYQYLELLEAASLKDKIQGSMGKFRDKIERNRLEQKYQNLNDRVKSAQLKQKYQNLNDRVKSAQLKQKYQKQSEQIKSDINRLKDYDRKAASKTLTKDEAKAAMDLAMKYKKGRDQMVTHRLDSKSNLSEIEKNAKKE